jgi:hypothetical protein
MASERDPSEFAAAHSSIDWISPAGMRAFTSGSLPPAGGLPLFCGLTIIDYLHDSGLTLKASRGSILPENSSTQFSAFVVALALSPVEVPVWLTEVLHRLGDTLAPLALVSVGMQLRLDQIAGVKAPLAIGLGFKLLIGPLLLAIMYVGFLHAGGNVAKITLFESAMGPQIGASIVAIQHGLNPPLITLLVGLASLCHS